MSQPRRIDHTLRERRMATLALALLLSGCGAQGLVGPALSSGLLGGGSPPSTLILQIDQAHGTLMMGVPSASVPTVSTVPSVVVPTIPPAPAPAPAGTIPTAPTPVG